MLYVYCSKPMKTTARAKESKVVAMKRPARDPQGAKESKRVKDERKQAHARLMEKALKAAGSFPMVELINEQVRSTVPAKIVKRVQAVGRKDIINPDYPYRQPLDAKDYERQMSLLTIELVKLQAWVKETGERVVLIFEGRDAAGKGGTIKRFTDSLNPRGARVVALPKPTETQTGQWYFQRYIEELPTRGEIVFYDRSWYNRAGVEHVMGFCSGHEYLEFMRQAPEFERMLVRSGIRLFKFWFSVSREEQLRRFLKRAKDPVKQWKLSPMDLESLARWDEYTKAKEAMLFYTDTADAPWTVVRSDDKRRARLHAMRFVLNSIAYAGRDPEVVTAPDGRVVGSARDIYEVDEFTPPDRPV
jgi:polyphosphate kinase 2